MKSLVLINSSYQAMCAIEYLLRHGGISNSKFISSTAGKISALSQIKTLLANFGTTLFYDLSIRNNGTLAERIGSYGDFYKRTLDGDIFDVVLIGDMRMQWMQDYACSVKSSKTILLDDGGANLAVYEHLLKQEVSELPVELFGNSTRIRRNEARKIKSTYGMDCDAKSFEIFTIFNKEAHPEISANDFSSISNYFNHGTPVTVLNEVHVTGGPFVENGYLDDADYYGYLEAYSRTAAEQGQLVYYLHRSEKPEKKREVLGSIGFEVRESEINYEFDLMKSNRIPHTVVSLVSTSLYNVKVIWKEKINARYIRLKDCHMDSLRKEIRMQDNFSVFDQFQQVYRRFNEYGVFDINEVI